MSPIFEQITNTTCRCFSPQVPDQSNHQQQKTSKKYLNLVEYLCGQWKGKIINDEEEEKAN